MGLRGKTIAIIISAFVCACLAFLGISRWFYSAMMERQGKEDAIRAFNRVSGLIDDDLEQLLLLANDWGVWTDLYDFAETGNATFIETSLSEPSIHAINLSAIFIFNKDTERFSLGDARDSLRADIAPGSPLYRQAEKDGVIRICVDADGRIHMLCARTILRSDGSGPSTGILAMCRLVDASKQSRWEKLTGTRIVREKRPGNVPPFGKESSFKKTAQFWTVTGPHPFFFPPSSGQSISVTPDSSSAGMGSQLFFFFALTLALLTALIIVLALVLFENFILKRIRRLDTELEQIALEGKPALRVSTEGSDELAQLGKVLNRTLEALETSFTEIDENRILLENSLKEQEALFQEVRHRVKNSLQLVASLVNLQQGSCDNPDTIDRLEENKRRVLAMAFIYEELYISISLDKIDLAKYLERLVISVQQSADQAYHIRIKLDLQSTELNIDQAVPFGLLVNEALSNAFFSLKRVSTAQPLQVHLSLENRGGIITLLLDSPERYIPSGLGVSLIDALQHQLDGEAGYTDLADGGVRFSLQFPILSSNP